MYRYQVSQPHPSFISPHCSLPSQFHVLYWCSLSSLAKAELFLTLATIFRRYQPELFDANRERDIDLAHDNFLPQPSAQSRPIRVIFKWDRWRIRASTPEDNRLERECFSLESRITIHESWRQRLSVFDLKGGNCNGIWGTFHGG